MSATTTSRLAAFREHRDHYFAHDPHSPLDPEQRVNFAGLAYFPERPDLALELPIETDGPGVGEPVELLTVDGERKPFVRAGRIRFTVAGQPVTLSVFKDVERGRFFLPFKDGTAGKESYAGGRYLDRSPGKAGRDAPDRPQLRLQPLLRVQRRLELPHPAGGEHHPGPHRGRRAGVSQVGRRQTKTGTALLPSPFRSFLDRMAKRATHRPLPSALRPLR